MLKSELERRLKEAEALAEDYRNAKVKLMRDLKDERTETESLKEHLNYTSDQLKQISQSVCTMLQVKYPDHYNDGNTKIDDNEDKRFLVFLHGLCIDRNYNMNSVSDVFRHLS